MAGMNHLFQCPVCKKVTRHLYKSHLRMYICETCAVVSSEDVLEEIGGKNGLSLFGDEEFVAVPSQAEND